MVFTLEIIEKGKGQGALRFHEIALNKYSVDQAIRSSISQSLEWLDIFFLWSKLLHEMQRLTELLHCV